MAPKPEVQGGPDKFPNCSCSPPLDRNVDTTNDELDPAEMARLYEEVERFERLTAGVGGGRRNANLGLEDRAFDGSTVQGMMLIIVVAMTIYGLTHLLVATFKIFHSN